MDKIRWIIFERFKQLISNIGLTPDQYEKVMSVFTEAMEI
jgi:hypothetical protein